MMINGFSLLELLISMSLCAIALLGSYALQMTMWRGQEATQLRLWAVQIADELASRMEVNRSYLQQHPSIDAYAVGFPAPYRCNTLGKTCDSKPNQIAEICSGDEMAQWDRCAMVQRLQDHLGHHAAELRMRCLDASTTDSDLCSPGSLYQLFVLWQPPKLLWIDPKTMLNAACRKTLGLNDARDCFQLDVRL